MRTLAVIAATLLAGVVLHAQTPQLVRDINHTVPASSWPADFVSDGRASYWLAFDENGQELWTTDGSRAGTHMVRDIAPAWISAFIDEQRMVISGDFVYFWAAVEGGFAVDLWRSDGTAAGTVRLTNFGNDVQQPGPIFPIGKHGAVFSADGLGVTDGTPEGTTSLDLDDRALPSDQILVSNGVLFSAGSGELWRSDLTASGTSKVATLGEYGAEVERMIDVHGILYIVTRTDSIDGVAYHLWRSDGTESGTRSIATFDGELSLQPLRDQLFIVASRYSADGLAADTEIWKSDGTESGTTRVCALSGSHQPGFGVLAATDDLLFFSVDEVFPSSQCIIWRSDGTASGTWSVGIFQTAALTAAATHNALFITQSYLETGLWTSSGEKVAMKKISPYWFGDMIAAGNAVIGGVYDGVHGVEPWISDGTANGTRLLANIAPDAGSWAGSPAPFGHDRVLFYALDDEHGFEAWITDGTNEGTHLLADVNPGEPSSYPSGFSDIGNGRALFCAEEPVTGRELWVTDGSAAGTHILENAARGAASTFFDQSGGPFPAVGGKALIPLHGSVWQTDGTEAGTTPVATSFVADLANTITIGDTLYAGGYGSVYRIDRNATIRLADGGPLLGAAGSTLFFIGTGEQNRELWATDGTAAGTHAVKAFDAPPELEYRDTFPYPFTASAGNALFFFADDGVHGTELWRSDGTEAGTHIIKDIAPGAASSYVFIYDRSQIAAWRGFIYFVADDGVHGAELWRTDGSDAGTRMVSDIGPGALSSFPSTLKVMFDRLYFSADDGAHGRELWSTDGVTASLVYDLNPGVAPSAPRDFFTLRESIFFFATRDDVGRELWRLDLPERRRAAR